MADQKKNDLPADLKEQFADGSEQIFQAAFSSAKEDGMSEDGAREVAWNTVKQAYDKGDDGKWHRKPEDSAIHNKSITTGGN